MVVIITACIAGLLGSLISGAIYGFIAGIILEIFYFTISGMDSVFNVLSYTSAVTGMASIPFGILIGLVTGVHTIVFRLFRINSFFWATITCLSAIAGLWFSPPHAPSLFQDIAIYLAIAIVSFATGWTTHRYAVSKSKDEKKAIKSPLLVVFGSMSSALIISSASCFYFMFMAYLESIPS
jgi:hypothetical protein